MKIINRNMKTGDLKIKIEVPEDLWHLEKVLETGDKIKARTMRKLNIKRGDDIIKAERKPMIITIELEKAELEASRLRLRGKIVSGPEDIQQSSYHSLLVETHTIVTVRKKRWRKDQMERIKQAQTKQPSLFICVLDREGADFGALRGYGVTMMGTVGADKIKGKEDDRSKYYSNVSKVIEEAVKDHDAIIIAGPGFEKENVFNYIKDKKPQLTRLISLENANSTGKTGIAEVIKTSANRVIGATRVAKETSLVEKLISEIGKNGMAVYGKEHTRKAALAGALETLLVSEEMAPENEGLMDSVQSMQGEVLIITSSHDAGERFLHLGGIGGILRYRFE